MPELITKHPDIVLQVLGGAGARCGVGELQRILKQCPPARFCATPRGELCVYGIEEIPNMTQITQADLAPVVCRNVLRGSAGCATTSGWAGSDGMGTIMMVGGVLVVLAMRGISRRRRQRRRTGICR